MAGAEQISAVAEQAAETETAAPLDLAIEAEALRDALARTVPGKNNNVPIWEHALFECSGREVKVTTTDSAKTLELTLPCRGTPGAATGDVAQLRVALTALGGEVTLRAKDGRLALQQGRRRFAIRSLPAQDYPAGPRRKFEPLDVDPMELGAALRAVAYAAAKADVRYYLNGACIDNDYVVATDGFRLAAAPLKRHAGTRLIVARDSIEFVAAHCLMNGEVSVARPDAEAPAAELCVRTSTAAARTRLIDARYPDSRHFFAAPDKAQAAVFSADDALEALARIAPFATQRRDEAGRGMSSLNLRCEGERICIGPADEAEESLDEVACESAAKKPFEARFNPANLIDLLRAAKGQRVTWLHTGPLERQHFRVEDSEVLHLIMPMK